MSRIASTGNIQIWYVPTIADESAPTVAEITAGVNLTSWLLRDGTSTPRTGNTIDVAGADIIYNATDAGTEGGDPISFGWFRDDDDPDDTAWDTLARRLRGYFVILRFVGSQETIVGTERCETWPIVVISKSHRDTEQDAAYRFDTQCAVPTEPNDDAVVAAA